MGLRKPCAEFILQMPFSKVFVVVSGQINQRKARGMKIGEVCAGGLQLEIQRGGKAAV